MDQDRRGQKMLRTGRLSSCMSQKPTGICLHHCCLVYVKTLCHVGGPLAIAWNLRASRWTQQLRVDYANDLAVVLLAVDRAANREARRRTTGVDAARQAQLVQVRRPLWCGIAEQRR